MDDVDGGGEVHALLGSLHDEEEEEGTGGEERREDTSMAWHGTAWHGMVRSATGHGLAVICKRRARSGDRMSGGPHQGGQTSTMNLLYLRQCS